MSPVRILSAATLAAVVATAPAPAAQSLEPPVRLSAIGINFNDQIGMAVRTTMAIDVRRWSDPGEQEAVVTAIRAGGANGLLELLPRLAELGSLRIENDTSVKFHIALTQAGRNGASSITLIGDRPVLWESANWGGFDRRALEYRFVALQLQLDGSGRGTGRLSLATSVSVDRVTGSLQLATWELLFVNLREVGRTGSRFAVRTPRESVFEFGGASFRPSSGSHAWRGPA